MNALMDVLIASIIAGSVLLISLKIDTNAKENLHVSRQSFITQKNIRLVSEIVEHDFRKMGHSLIKPKKAITLADTSHIVFSYDRNPSSVYDSMRVEYSTGPAPATQNPNDFKLFRKLNNASPNLVSIGITKFFLRYFNKKGALLTTPVVADSLSSINIIEIAIQCQSTDKIRDRYEHAKFLTRITPKNLLAEE